MTIKRNCPVGSGLLAAFACAGSLPVRESTVKRCRIRIAQQRGDRGEATLRIAQQLARHLVARFVVQLAKTRSRIHEAAVQSAWMNRKVFCQLIARATLLADQDNQRLVSLVAETLVRVVAHFLNLLEKFPSQHRIGKPDRLVKPVGRKHQAGVLGIEFQGGLKETAIGFDSGRVLMTQPDLGWEPIRSAQGAHDVQADSHRAIGDLVRALNAVFVNLITKDGVLIRDFEEGCGAAIMQIEIGDQFVQRRLHIGGVPEQEPNGAGAGDVAPLTDQ